MKNEKSKNEETDQASTGKLVASLLDQAKEQNVKDEGEGSDQASMRPPSTVESGILDFRIQGLQHSEVEQVEGGRVRQLMDKIETHLRKGDLQADLRQDNVYYLFSENSKEMIYESGNIA